MFSLLTMDVPIVPNFPNKLCLIILFILSFSRAYAQQELPIFAAYISETLETECATKECKINAFDATQLTQFISRLEDAHIIADALSVSDYEVLIGNALVYSTDNTSAELVLEITTSWRKVPIDDFIVRATVSNDDKPASVTKLLANWFAHIEKQKVLEADKIYSVLGASDYHNELSVPQKIGEFELSQSALYRDPLQGSITRYAHPQYDDAVVDISVYPFSPFNNRNSAQNISTHSSFYDELALLQDEMESEIEQIEALISQAQIQDYDISNIEPAVVKVGGEVLEGFRIQVLLNKSSDPIYSTQYLFKQNDKFIKLTGNLPDFMMTKLVAESLPKIKVPSESAFMKTLRQS